MADLFDVVVARKLSDGGGGGGGSSDFSTAQVTIVGNSTNMALPRLFSNNGISAIATMLLGYDEGTYEIVLWEDGAAVEINEEEESFSVSGNIQQMFSTTYLITGDCTITIS